MVEKNKKKKKTNKQKRKKQCKHTGNTTSLCVFRIQTARISYLFICFCLFFVFLPGKRPKKKNNKKKTCHFKKQKKTWKRPSFSKFVFKVAFFLVCYPVKSQRKMELILMPFKCEKHIERLCFQCVCIVFPFFVCFFLLFVFFHHLFFRFFLFFELVFFVSCFFFFGFDVLLLYFHFGVCFFCFFSQI